MKKLIAVLLSLIMALSFVLPVFAQSVEDDTPIIYLRGAGGYLYNSKRELIYPLSVDWGDFLQENMKDFLLEAFIGLSTGDYSAYNEDLVNKVVPELEEIKLNDAGEADNGSVPGAVFTPGADVQRFILNLPVTELTQGEHKAYNFYYDWRLSPVTLADGLNDLIDAVIEKTGKPQVNIISRCLGTNIVYAYMCKYGTEKVKCVALYSPMLLGNEVLDPIFSGKVKIESDSLNAFIQFYQKQENITIRDDETTALILSLISLFNQVKVLGFGADVIQKIYDDVKNDSVAEILRQSYATFPSYWSMVKAENYEAAKEYIFGGYEEQYAGLIEKTDEYYAYQLHVEENLEKWSETVKFINITKYGSPNFPLSENCAKEGDGMLTVENSSFGAVTAESWNKLSDSYLKNVSEENQKYVSPDGKIDASTCMFRDSAWFIKNLPHDDFPNCVNDLIIAFFRSGGEMTPDSDPRFSRFMEYTSTKTDGWGDDSAEGILTGIITPEDTEDTTQNYDHSKLEALFKFIYRLIAFVITIIKDVQ